MKYKHAKLVFFLAFGFLFGSFLRVIGLQDIKLWQAILIWLWVCIPTLIVFYLLEKQCGIDKNDIIE